MPVFNQGEVISSFASPSTAPQGLGIDGQGCFWHSDLGTDRIYKLDKSGTVQASFDSPSSSPRGVTVDSAGCLWHADATADRIYKLDKSGTVQASFDSPDGFPGGLGVDSAGCLWHAGEGKDRIYKLDKSGTVQASFAPPSTGPYGIDVDGDGCLWHSDGAADRIYKLDKSGTVQASFASPSSRSHGIAVGGNDRLWNADGMADSVYELAEEALAVAVASKPTAGATATGVQSSHTVSATATRPTATATARLATDAGNAVAQATKPAAAATATTAPGNTSTTSPATLASASATATTPDGYATTPLIDGVPVEDVEQTVRFEDLELEFRVTSAELDTLRPLQSHAGKYEINRFPDGSYRVRDTTGGNNTYRYTPRQAETPFVQAQDVVVDSYSEVPIAQGGDEYRVEIVFKFLSPPTPTTDLINESKTATDWLFDTYAGTIATPRIRRAVEAETESGALGYSFSLFCDESQADALRTALGHLGAVGTQGSERADADPVDNSPDKSNSVRIEPRDTAQVARGQYVVRDVEFERLDPDGTWYGVRLEVVPQDEPVVVGDRASVTATPTQAGLSASANIHAGSTPPTGTWTATEGVGDTGRTAAATATAATATATTATADEGVTATATKPTATWTATEGTRTSITWSSAADWDGAVSEDGVVHQSLANTDHNDAAVIKQGYDIDSPFKSASLLLYAPLHEDSGSVFTDFSGNNLNGSINGASLGGTGLLETTAPSFDGSNDDGDFGSPSELDNVFDGGGTVACWLEWTSGQYVMSTDENQNGWFFDMPSDNQNFRFTRRFSNNLGQWEIPAASTLASGWHHVAVAYDSASAANAPSIFIDGSAASLAENNSPSGTRVDDSADAFKIATLGRASLFYGGRLAEVRAYDTVFSQGDAASLFNVVDTAGSLTASTKTFASSQQPDLTNVSYSLNTQSITVDVIGSPAGTSETVSATLDGTSSFGLTWSSSHTDFRIKPKLSGTDYTRSASFSAGTLE